MCKKLWANVNYLRKRLTEEGFDIGSSVSAIFPIMVRDNRKVYRKSPRGFWTHDLPLSGNK